MRSILLKWSFALLLNLITFAAFSQVQAIKFEECINDCEKQFNFKTQQKGIFAIKLINANNKIISMPIFNKMFEKNENVAFEIDTKLWKPGNYLIVIENDKKINATQKIKILPSSLAIVE